MSDTCETPGCGHERDNHEPPKFGWCDVCRCTAFTAPTETVSEPVERPIRAAKTELAEAWKEGCLAVCNGGIDECGMSEGHMHPEQNPYLSDPEASKRHGEEWLTPTREQVLADEQAAWDEWNRWGATVTNTPMIREAHRAGYLAGKGIAE